MLFSAAAKQSGGNGTVCHRPVDAHQPLHSARSCRSRAKVEGAACGEPSGKVCETADGRTTFKNDVWKHFGFPASRNNKGEKDSLTKNITLTHTHLL